MSGYKFQIVRGTDTIEVEILEDGTIKTETDVVSAANHATAENFLAEMFRLAGGVSEIVHKRPLPIVEGHHHHNHHHTH